MEIYSNTKEGQLEKESVGQRTWADRRCNAKGKRCVGYSQVQRYDDESARYDDDKGEKGVCVWGCNKAVHQTTRSTSNGWYWASVCGGAASEFCVTYGVGLLQQATQEKGKRTVKKQHNYLN